MKKIGFYGGSFDPIHNAHVKCAIMMKESLKLDKLLIIPAKLSPYKNATHTSSKHRYNMCCLAFEGYNDIEVSKIELEREGHSYTCDTIEVLKKEYLDTKLYMFVGADMFVTLQNWKNAEYVLSNVSVVTVVRNDIDAEKLEIKKKELLQYCSDVIILKAEPMLESSTLVREDIKNVNNIENLVPQKVADYIEQNKLYRS